MGIDEVKAVFLDRDGVINASVVREGKPYPPASLEEMQYLPGVGAAIDQLHAAGFVTIVVTNQPDVARGTQLASEVDRMHAAMQRDLGLTAVYACMHDDADKCHCRKPLPGMITDAARDLGIDLSKSFMVGDRWRDIDAGIAAGVTSIFIDRGYSERKPDQFAVNVAGLLEAVAWILEQIK
ncbi:MAG: HAD family hydrolase [Kofleriaceae bacterium]